MKKLLSVMVAAAAVGTAFGNAMPDPEAAKLLKELAKSSETYRRRTNRTYFFSRAQLKYGLERSDYVRRWCDRPLMQETGFAKAGTFTVNESGKYKEKGFLNRESFRVESNLLVKYNFAGFAFFPELTGRPDIYNHVGKPGNGQIVLLPEFFAQFKEPTLDEVEERMRVAERALQFPHTFRIDGKIVITSYPCSVERNMDFWVKLKKDLTARFGDKFILMPWLPLDYGMRPSGKNRQWTVADIRKMQERLRGFLRQMDGFYYNTPPFKNRRYHWEFDREVAIPIIHSVMNEPEFRGKYLGWGTKVGHMNCHEQPYGVDAYNTDTLRGSVGAAVLAKADFVNCVEWDEENENTSFRPMTMTGFSTLRICRAFEQLANGGKFSPLPGDDLSIPNVVLSYPRVLAAGQTLEIEVANIPDGEGKKSVSVAVELHDNDGNVVWKSPVRELDRTSIGAVTFQARSEELLRHRFLNPAITVDGRTFDRGFYPIELRSWWHWDYLYAKHVLRDMPVGVKADLSFSAPDANGLTNVNIKVSSPTELRSIELISGDNQVLYSHDSSGIRFMETADTVAFRVSMQALNKTPLKLTGSIRFLNMPGLEVSPTRTAWRGKNAEWKLKNFNLAVWPVHRYFSIPRKELDNAVLEIDLPELTKEKTFIKLADVYRKGSVGIAGPYSSNLVVRRNNLQERMPDVLGGKAYEFSVPVRPDVPEAGYLVQVIDKDYRIFRTRKKTPFVPSGRMTKINVFSVGENRRAVAEVDESFVKPLEYDFSAARGSVLGSSLGTRLDGILCGFVPLTTGFGQGETLYGNRMVRYFGNSKKYSIGVAFRDSIPGRLTENGRTALVFNGGQYVSLPLGIIPPFAGYEIEMEVYVEKNGAMVQTLLTDTWDAFTLRLIDRVPTVNVYRNQLCETIGAKAMQVATGPRLRPWQWNKIVVRFDQDKLTVITNGVAGEPVQADGYHRYPRATVLGASDRGEFFTGRIRNFSITPR